MGKHTKHADIKRPSLGKFGRYELGMIGAPCSVIRQVVDQLSITLRQDHKITYIDADHNAADLPLYTNLSDKITYDRIDFGYSLNEYDRKLILGSSDIIIVNGNHFLSNRQIVFCTEKKRASLEKKANRLTDVGLIILDQDILRPHDYLFSCISNIDEIPIIRIDQINLLANWISTEYAAQMPSIKGLVLAGGKSLRMGQMKATLDYHGMPQVSYACKQLSLAGVEPTISCRMDQTDDFNDQFALLFDTHIGLGPYGAILSAFRSDPDAAWLVMACDQPLLSTIHLKYLIDHRHPSKVATCFHNPQTGFPEPIITLWEPRAYPRLLSFLSLGYSCPRKVLINSDINELRVDDTGFMINANTPDERNAILNNLSHCKLGD